MNNERRKQFPFDEFEPKWQRLWEEAKAFHTSGPGDSDFDSTKPKYYALDMFPYPSGQGLHVGHPEGYTATDIVTRFKKMRGFNVLHPMGWDAFGLPAEQYAIKTGQHPRKTTEANIDGFRAQLKRLGFAYDWEREVNTTDPEYFKWTQWIFLQLYHSYFDEKTNRARPVAELEAQGLKRDEIDARRLAYVKEAPVWWCPELGTVLANEEVVDGKSEVGGFPVERRPMRQWMLRITAYAQRLIDELDGLDWPEGIKLLQRNWIGKSEGAEVHFKVADLDETITVFTTRPDTLFGATYMVLAPEHRLVDELVSEDQIAGVEQYRERTARKSDLERTELAKEKSGVFTGAHAINPVNNERIPIWIADYVLMGYGTGAIMAVPAHDERDFEFATKFGLPIRRVVAAESSDRSKGVSPLPDSVDSQEPIITHDIEDGVDIHHGETLPHWRLSDATYAVCFRLADAVPAATRVLWETERREIATRLKDQSCPLTKHETDEIKRLYSEKVQRFLDAGQGSCALRDHACGECVASALKHFDDVRYELLAWCVMPNHVHAVLKPKEGHELSDILQSWKSFTAKAINQLRGSHGELWQADTYNRLIRDELELRMQVRYVLENPERAGLEDWKWVGVTTCLGKIIGCGNLGNEQGRDALATLAPFASDGVAVNSDFLDGLPTPEAKAKITAWLTEKGLGAKTTNFKLRDWLFSRQRYWGEPFPIIWEEGHHRAVPEGELPVIPPDLDDFKPTGTPEPPLSKATSWVKYSEKATRELNTMPQWAGSCWYYLRYCDPKNTERFISKEAESYWMGRTNVECGMRNAESVSAIPNSEFRIPHSTKGGVDLYVGGTEHAVLHLLYARFWHKVLFDLGHVSTPEPFQRLVNQGLILGEDGQKMSKSRGNVVNPDDVILEYGADSLRLYEMFMGPLEQVKPWQMQGVEGVYRFLARVWRLVMESNQEGGWSISPQLQDAPTGKKLNKIIHETIKKVGEDIEKLSFNTSISQMMVLTNAFTQSDARPASGIMTLLQVLNPFAPHVTEELAARIGEVFPKLKINGLLAHQTWPEFEASALIEDEVEVVLQVNGKLRDRLTVAKDIAKEEMGKLALASAKVIEFTQGLTIRKVVVVPGKLVNVVAN